MHSRGSLLQGGISTSLVCAVAPLALSGLRTKRVLVLGGTYFLGPAIVAALLKSGHEVTLFNRGKTNPSLFPRLERLHGDRQRIARICARSQADAVGLWQSGWSRAAPWAQ